MNNILPKKCWKFPAAMTAGVVAVALFGSAGCTHIDKLRGDGFQDNSMGEAVRESQPPSKKPQEFWSFSNKARQIESDFPE